MLWPRQPVFRRERPQGGRMIGAIEQGLREIEQIPPAAAAPAPEPFIVVPSRAVDAERRPVIVVEWAEGGSTAAPVEAHAYVPGLEQVRDVDVLPQCVPKIVERSAHERRKAAFAVVRNRIRAEQCDWHPQSCARIASA